MVNDKTRSSSRIIKNGYTLIELIISLAIMAMLFSGGYTAYRDYVRRQTLQTAAADLKSNLALARQKSLSGDNASACTSSGNNLGGYQVIFSSNQYTIGAFCTCTGTSCSPAQPAVSSTISLPDQVTMTDTLPGHIIQYKVIAAGTNLSGSATITLTHNSGGGSKTLTILSDGVVQ